VELEALQEALPEIEAEGATLVAISPMVERFVRQVVMKNNLTFHLLLDKGNAVAGRFGIVHTFPDYLKELYLQFGNDFVKFNGDDSWTLPMPARYVIDREGIIRASDVNPDYTVRPEPDKTIADLTALRRIRD
jgi:peroxiredoxin